MWFFRISIKSAPHLSAESPAPSTQHPKNIAILLLALLSTFLYAWKIICGNIYFSCIPCISPLSHLSFSFTTLLLSFEKVVLPLVPPPRYALYTDRQKRAILYKSLYSFFQGYKDTGSLLLFLSLALSLLSRNIFQI